MEGKPKNSEGPTLCGFVLKRSTCALVLIPSATLLSREGRPKNSGEVRTSCSSRHSCSHSRPSIIAGVLLTANQRCFCLPPANYFSASVFDVSDRDTMELLKRDRTGSEASGSPSGSHRNHRGSVNSPSFSPWRGRSTVYSSPTAV